MKTRVQPFTLMLDLYGTRPRLRCISPVGRVHPDARQGEIIASAWRLGARIGAILEIETGSYDLTVEEDVLLAADPRHDGTRLEALLRRVVDQVSGGTKLLSLLVTGIGTFTSSPWWRAAAFALAMASTVLCVLGLPGAKIGILANALLLAYLALTKLGWLPAIR